MDPKIRRASWVPHKKIIIFLGSYWGAPIVGNTYMEWFVLGVDSFTRLCVHGSRARDRRRYVDALRPGLCRYLPLFWMGILILIGAGIQS